MNAELILKCEGRVVNNLLFCSGVENVILDLAEVYRKDHYLKLLDYLANVSRIFNKPCFDPNIISNTLYKIYSLDFWTQKEYEVICNWVRLHRPCGVMLLAKPKEKTNE